ncbi:ATP-binding domain-containing protein [Actinoplanes sp. NEAU-A12]|uniref:ATP-binding domain-containing protein n=1 Tax=Actinoplanes sandaracinus TaxID=3045177 RepID=A0ABT6WUT1_9ACTN|nr:ATP-binding domain-containing protein [Actinoplanes sandaracinus]MDI6103503.1 ATP-binding domain-containing protein [Actinoplanes sandaracinus]
MLYHRLDEMRDRVRDHLAGQWRQAGGTPQARSQRDTAARGYAERLARYEAVEQGLCFGRLDPCDGAPLHIGRIGIHDPERPLLVDWRAAAARPFYVATAVTSYGISRRRHIRTRGRTVTGLDDEILGADAAAAAAGGPLVGEAALIAALDTHRTGRMRDIVETIQAEQDRVIRSAAGGVLVVQGGPGTGKTAVALHRAAYLLYTYREQLSARGVLIIGPNPTFLRYISQVLPSLAETGVLLATPGDLFPGVVARRTEPAEVAEVKGRAEMVDFLVQGLRDRQRVPLTPIEIEVDRHVLRLDRYDCEPARRRARDSGLLHNLARPIFVAGVLDVLAAQIAERIGDDPFWDDPLGEDDAPGTPNVLDDADLADLRADLAADPAVRAVLDDLWPVLTPEEFLTGLYATTTRAELRRAPGGGWTPADVPLLDEAAELLGEDDRAARAREERRRRRRLEYAQGVLDISAGSKSYEAEDDVEAEIPNVADVMEAEMLAERYADRESLPAAERAAADRSWAFGHVIVDEAQEISPMAWRLLMRRCPSRSMTVVGDLAQTGSLGGCVSWGQVLSPYVADRWRLAELTVSYRTPAEIMAYAGRLLADADPPIDLPRPVRSTGVEPREEVGDAARLAELVGEAGAGSLAVIVPRGRRAKVAAALPGLGQDLEEPAVLLTVTQAKGLEFDTVVLVDPELIRAESPRGVSDLYVALTRATQRLTVFRFGPG